MGVVEKARDTQLFLEESWAELQKVTWPDYEQLKSATLVVIIFVFIISAIIALMDMAIRTLLAFIMGIFGA